MEVLCFSTCSFWRWWEARLIYQGRAREGENEYPSWFPANNKGQGTGRQMVKEQWSSRLRIRMWWDRDSRWKEKRTSGLEKRAVERGEQGWDKAQLSGDWKKEVSAGKHPHCADWVQSSWGQDRLAGMKRTNFEITKMKICLLPLVNT